ncbi:MAG: type IV secretory system conjugative DNA transfer family protein [Alphaproteobacteria bacterium]|nr:type IV secretory system conjugative DNA transfer family protein [Alphaproteobacteria bacterium]
MTAASQDLFDGFPRGVFEAGEGGRSLEQQAMPRAAFLRTEAVRRSRLLAYDPTKIFLGVIDGIAMPSMKLGHSEIHGGQAIGFGDDTHAMTIAGNRSGKGRSSIIPTLLSYAGATLVTDVKGELATITAASRAAEGYRVFVADPFDIVKGPARGYRARFNPLSILRPGSATMIEDAGLIADALVVPGNTQDPHWDDSSRGFIEGVVLFVATDQLFEGRRTLATVRDLISGQASSAGETGMDVLAVQMQANNAADGHVRQAVIDAAEDFFAKPDDERGSVLSNTRRHLRFLSYPQIRENVSGHDFDLAALKTGADRKPVSIYLCLPAMRMGTCNRWFRLFVNLALAQMEQIPINPEPPVLFCLDEFPVLGHMQALENAAGQVAGFGVKLWVIIQDIGQLKALYKERWQTFLGNAGMVQLFGLNDLDTLEWVSKRLGTTSLIVRNKSEVSDRDATSSGRLGATWSLQTQPLMTFDEIARLFGRFDPLCRQLVIIPGFDPIVLQRVNYDSHELFKGRFDAPAF